MIKSFITVRGTTRSTKVGDEGDPGVVAGSKTVPMLESDSPNTRVKEREGDPESARSDEGMTYDEGSQISLCAYLF